MSLIFIAKIKFDAIIEVMAMKMMYFLWMIIAILFYLFQLLFSRSFVFFLPIY